MNKRLAGFYIAIAVIGIVTAVPILGSYINIFNVGTAVLLGFSIYVLVKQPKEIKKRAAILMIISCGLAFAGWLVILLCGFSAAGGDYNDSLETFVGGSILSLVFLLPAWVLKILSIIFSFIAAKDLRKLDEIDDIDL